MKNDTPDQALKRFHGSYEQVTESGCWIWMGTISPKGYGQFHCQAQRHTAHRWIYEQLHGTIPEKECSHLCGVRACVNPDHLHIARKGTDFERFLANIRFTESCWEWTGRDRGTNGYGGFYMDKQDRFAHRVAWFFANGEHPPREMEVCHHCDNKRCVRIDHLFLGTRSDNQRDAVAKGLHFSQKKTACKHGHPFTPENTILDPLGRRSCRTCQRFYSRRYWRVKHGTRRIVS